jgi:hypothetical protein
MGEAKLLAQQTYQRKTYMRHQEARQGVCR